MPYQLDFIIHKEFLEVHLNIQQPPEAELEEAIDRWKKIVQKCRETGLKRVLVAIDFTTLHGPGTAFNLIRSARKFGWGQDFSLAVVVRRDHQYTDLKFTETAMQNFGLQMKLFKNHRKAKRWLLKETT